MDFAKIVKTIDLGKDDETIEEIGKKQLKDDKKIKEFYAKKSNYYKNLKAKQGVFQTADDRNARGTEGITGGLRATKV